MAATPYLIAALLALVPLSVDASLPALPAIEAAFGASSAAAELTLSAFVAGYAGAQLLCGPLSDRFGRRPVLLAALALYVLAGLAAVAAPSVGALVWARAAMGLGGGAAPVLARAVVRDLYGSDGTARMLSLTSAGMGLVPVAAPLLAGAALAFGGWRAAFALFPLAGAALLCLVALGLAESNVRRDPRALAVVPLLRTFGAVLRHPGSRAHVLTLGCCAAGLYAWLAGSPFVLIQVLDVRPEAFGLCFGAVMAAYVVGALASGAWSGRIGATRMLVLGLLLSAAGGGLLLAGAILAPRLPFVLVPAALFVLGFGIATPLAAAGAIRPFPHAAGAASAMAGLAQNAGGALAGAVVGRIFDGTVAPMAATVAVTSIAALLVYVLAVPADGG